MKIGIIGTGHGKTFIDKCKLLNLDIVAIYGHQNRNLYPEYNFAETKEEVIDRSDVIISAVPPQVNVELCRLALPANKPIFLEKPVSLEMPDLMEIKSLITQYDGIVMIGHCLCYSDTFAELKEKMWDFAVVRNMRPFPPPTMNPFWNIGIHYLALFDFMKLKDWGIELVFDNSYSRGTHNITLYKDSEVHEWQIIGDIYLNEIRHFVDCCQNHLQPMTDIDHAERVMNILISRYGKYNEAIVQGG
jgi:hypothetical protein